MSVRVKFNDAESFIGELGYAVAAGQLVDRIVRVSRRLCNGSRPGIKYLNVEASFLFKPAADQSLQIVHLLSQIGEVGYGRDRDRPVYEEADGVQRFVEEKAVELACDIRDGAFELAGQGVMP